MKMEEVFKSGVVTEGLAMFKNRFYGPYLNDMVELHKTIHRKAPDRMTMASWGHALRNFHEWVSDQPKNEATSQSSMPFLRDYGFELITAMLPGLIANEIFTTQPARFKNYSIFYQDFEHQTTKGPITAGDRAISGLRADNIDENYTRDSEVDRTIGVGTGAAAGPFAVGASVLFLPVIAGSVTVTTLDTADNPMVAVDNGVGGFTGDVTGGTINYTTGAIVGLTFTAFVKSGEPVLLTYEFVGEGSQVNAAEYGLVIRELQGQAKERRIRYNFSIESQFSYRQQFGRSIDADLMAGAVAQVRKEIDQDLLLTGSAAAAVTTGPNASAGTVQFDRTPDTGVQYYFWREQFIDTLNAAGNLIFKATGFGVGNVAVGGINFKQVCETIGPRFKPSGLTGVKGSHWIGDLDGGKVRCYVEPALGDDEFFVTYKGGPLEVGLSYNPWMPLYASDPHMLDDGKLHRYLVTSSGKRLVNPKLFAGGTLIQS